MEGKSTGTKLLQLLQLFTAHACVGNDSTVTVKGCQDYAISFTVSQKVVSFVIHLCNLQETTLL